MKLVMKVLVHLLFQKSDIEAHLDWSNCRKKVCFLKN